MYQHWDIVALLIEASVLVACGKKKGISPMSQARTQEIGVLAQAPICSLSHAGQNNPTDGLPGTVGYCRTWFCYPLLE